MIAPGLYTYIMLNNPYYPKWPEIPLSHHDNRSCIKP